MKYKEPKAMREIHRIREEIHEEIKDLSPEERVRLVHKRAEKFLKERNMLHLMVRDEEIKALKRKKK